MAIQTTYSIEQITQRRLKKKEEIKASKEHMKQAAQELFTPQKSKNKIEGLIQQVNTGMAAYDGIMTGFKILKRIRLFFSNNRTTKSKQP